MDEIDRNPVYELNSKNGYWSDSRFRDKIASMLADGSISSVTWQLFVKMILMDTVCYKKLLLQLLLSLELDSDSQFINLFPRFCVTDCAILDAKKMFVQMTERGRFLLILLARVVTFEMDCQLIFQMVEMWGEINFLLHKLRQCQFVSTILCHSFCPVHLHYPLAKQLASSKMLFNSKLLGW
ncbi:uncharacterized protein LOC113304803 isoform X3 [Papaver somniferum]|uniref:uncharacterized protein LOC113304803 isoform X3 n=1 Tax=Papaver somniferum TaxID=3469 RepID=UPI000E6FE5EB|nr:uncharacterized protein LOC113304803 isoform X3 [Papaver somniferum]